MSGVVLQAFQFSVQCGVNHVNTMILVVQWSRDILTPFLLTVALYHRFCHEENFYYIKSHFIVSIFKNPVLKNLLIVSVLSDQNLILTL